MAPDSIDAQPFTTLPEPDKIQKHHALDAICNGFKATRHPRWSKEETFVLIEGKKVVENRVCRGRRSTSALGSDQIQPKWDSISSYCKQHGVNREPVQCRKRWSNLLGDFKKIKIWESQRLDADETFWNMRNEVRRERKLPSFFDRDVYDILNGRLFATEAIPLTLVTVKTEKNTDGDEAAAAAAEEQEEEEDEAVFDSGQNATSDCLFSDFEQSRQDEIRCSLKKETIATKDLSRTQPISGTTKQKNPDSTTWMGSTSQKEWKRRRLSSNGYEDTNLADQLIKVLERNSNMLSAELEAQNINYELDRSQRKEHNDNLVAVLHKLTDALVRIAEKL
ncbi:trihelix transcription factor ASR3-like [Hevea brasiliensis]|uniref:trihelix transcription factor ASR3-like n=1 Tax=Hevea brasiliensis TaxID=3981 RepID=UPI0025F3717B|nr:trihelix transcription factor ASR3-like [Hevea brasiliensis]